MKIIVLLGGTNSPLNYFANSINEHHKIDLIVLERSKKSINKNNISKENVSFFEKGINYIKFRIEQNKQKNNKLRLEADLAMYHQNIFNNNHLKISKDIPILIVDSINSKEAELEIARIKPDLIIDHGTSLVKDNIIDLAKLSLNLHWGLSPYYRGVMCTNQALLNWDINNIGVTIHRLAKKIDGGDVLGQKRLTIKPDDTITKITSRLTLEGTKIIIKVISMMKNDEKLTFTEQDFKQGFITRGINWDPNLDKFTNEINEDILRKMISKPSREKAPITEL